MSDDIAIKIQNVDKTFRLPHEKKSSVKSIFTSIGKRGGSSYELQQALKDISLEVKKGEFFGIVGRNGSGKSTLLKIIAGIYRPNSGSVKVSGRLVPFIELGVGFNPELTGRENVYLNGALMGFSSNEVDRKYDAIVDFAELERFMDQKLKNYSSGMQVRLAFSVATILAESDILLIDEVLAVGDADFQRKCFEYFKKLKKEKKTVIFVSHDMAAVREYCDNAVLIDKSKIIFKGTAQEASKEYTKLFLPHIYKAQRDEERAKKHAAAQKGSDDLGKWGAGGVDMNDAVSKKGVYETSDKMVTISYTVTALNGFEDEIIPGITIKDERGQPVCGTNSNILAPQKKIHIGKTGKETLTFTWEVPNIFNQGKYTVDPAVLSGTTTDTLQWWDEAISFRVVNEFSAPYPVSPQIELKTDA
jgi:ABC-2 type transport system ATP-binding protein